MSRGAYWGGSHAHFTPTAATKGAYYYGASYVKKDIQNEKAAKYDGATDNEEVASAGMSALSSCVTNASNTSDYTEATVGSLGSDDSFISTEAGAGTKEQKSGTTTVDAGAGTKDQGDSNDKVINKISAGTRKKDVEELESTKVLKARGTQGGGGNGIFH